MRRILIFFSLALLVAAGLPAAAQMIPPEKPPVYEGPEWFPAPIEMVFDIQLEHPGAGTNLEPPEGLLPSNVKPGPIDSGGKPSLHGRSSVSAQSAQGVAGGAVLTGSALGHSFDPVAELDMRVRDARRALDS
jgi:hypothetical protein